MTPAVAGMPVEELWRDYEPSHVITRARNCLLREGVATVGELTDLTEWDLLDVRNLGPAGIAEIRRILALHGLSLRPSRRLQGT